MRIVLLALSICCLNSLLAQPTVGLVAYFPFDSTAVDATGNVQNDGTVNGSASYSCGIVGNAILLDGFDDHVIFPTNGPLAGEFDTEDFTISFYMKPTGEFGTLDIISKREDCSVNNAFAIQYSPVSRTLNTLVGESSMLNSSVNSRLPEGVCWQHIVFIRRGRRIELYVNNEFVGDSGALERVNISNDAPLLLAKSPCQSSSVIPFKGLIDELRFYNRALDEEEIDALYLAPDRLESNEADIFLGDEVNVFLNSPCSDNFSWTPDDGVSDITAAEPTIEPPLPGVFVYRVNMSTTGINCIATDSIRITVVDPNNLDCTTAFVPNAFTPNGDNLNDTYGINNPFAIQDLKAFEIFDRWGNLVFTTDDPFQQWDGSYKGTEVNPGVFLYRINHICNGDELFESGSLTVIR